MKRGLFRQIFFLYFLISCGSILFLTFFLSTSLRSYYVETLEDHLLAEARILGQTLGATSAHDMQAAVERFAGETDSRITIVGEDGTVLGDSRHDAETMENHGKRPEIRGALQRGTGVAVRRSATLDRDFLYAAVKRDGSTTGTLVVRTAVTLRKIDAAVGHLRTRVVVVVALVLAAVGLFAAWQTRRVKKVAEKIAGFSRGITAGDFDNRLRFEGYEEFDEIAENMNTMAEKLAASLGELRQETERLNAILAGIPDALLIIDADGTVILSSGVSAAFFQVPKLVGSRVDEVVRAKAFHELLDLVKEKGITVTEEMRVDTPREQYWSVRVSPFTHGGNGIEGFIAIFNDITQIVKLEHVRKDFVANASHEIKTPITAIKGFAETLLEGAIDDRDHALKFLGTIAANSDRINRLVDDLMTISKIELGVIPIEKTVLDLQELTDAAVDTLQDKARKKGLTIRTWIRDGARSVEADRYRLIQILTNLVDNAIKFTETGSITVGTGIEDGKPYLYVKDTGVGIPPEHLERIGERFYRVDPSRSRELGGTGLGLAIVKHLVKAHGWTWAVESNPGQGTRVKVYFRSRGPEVRET